MPVTGADLIVAERAHQISKGYTTQHDLDEHEANDPLASALLNDAMNLISDVFNGEENSSAMMACNYPFGASAIDKLVMAGALVAAQLDALLETEPSP